MFSKRRRAASNPPQRSAPPPSASASLAATKAFVRSQASDANLSNAAAAAALRTHATSPTPVGETVTKRMVRRGSTSSQGSQRPQGLRRHSSSGSMTERSFRNASPGRGSPVVPPVPAVPQNIPGAGGSVHRRASSLEPVYRGGSPTQRGGGRGVSLDRGSGPSVNRVQRVASPLAQVSEEGHDQRQSVNFSRPMSPALTTTAGGPSTSHGWFGGPVVNQEAVQRMASTSRPRSSSAAPNTYYNTQQSVQNAANRPVSTHYVQQGQEGMRLSTGSMRAKPSGTAVQSRSFLPATSQPSRPVDPKSPDAVYDPSTRTFIHKQDAMNIHREQHQQPEEPAQHYISRHLQSSTPVQSGRGRTPSPLRYSVQQEQSPRQVAQPLLPKHSTAAETTRYEERPLTPPSSQPSSGAILARQHSEDYAQADVRPVDFIPIDIGQANTGHGPESQLSPQFSSNQDSSYPRIGTPVNTASNVRVGHVREDSRTERHASLSPARHATFAPNTIELAGLKHEPLPRSMSPAKSALKSSPSVSRRSNSPLAPSGRGFSKPASSAASDTASEDGYGKKKKKTVRVSFEQEPIIAGTSAYGDMERPSSPAGPTPYKPIEPAQTQDEFEDFMKPRPALPSFGSVRDKTRPRDDDDVPQKVTETVSTPMSASVASMGEPLEASTDLGLGHIVAQDFASKEKAASDPLPPDVTSVEGSGYVSESNYSTDGESSVRKHADPATLQSLPELEPKSLTKPMEEQPSTLPVISEQVVQVPNIAVLPATPSPYEHPEPRFQNMMAPGGWIEQDEEQRTSTAHVPIQFQPIQTPASFQQQMNEPTSSPSHDADTTDDDSSVYSDAYEEVSDMEGGFGSINAIVESPVIGSTPSSSLMASKHADKSITDSPTPQSKNEASPVMNSEPVDTATRDWEAARAHWSGINRPRDHDDKPVTSNHAHLESVAARVLQAPVQEEELRTERKPAVQTTTRVVPETTPRVSMSEAPPRTSMSSQPSQTPNKPLKSALKKTTPSPASTLPPSSGEPQMRKTMRGAAPSLRDSNSSQMRSTMRGSPGPAPRAATQMRTSMRGDGPAPANMALAASRQSAGPADTKPPRGALQKKHIPAGVAASKARPQSQPAPAPKQAMAPVPTYDSDSDASASSFQRSRARRNQGGGFAMRSSMRGGPTGPTMRATAPAPAQVRSISPPRASQSNFRQSMRPSSPSPERVKSSRFSIRSLSPAGRFRKKQKEVEPPVPALPRSTPKPSTIGKQSRAKAPTPAKSSAFKSRFADSSDEDEDRPSRFTSRFEDSDSEPEAYELPPGLAPVRGIPRKAGEEDGDSTDLEEEVEAPPPAAVSAPITNGHSNGTANAQGTALAAGSLRDSKHAPASPAPKAKRGFFGMGKKKTSSTPAQAQAPTQAAPVPQPTSPTTDIPLPPQPRSRDVGGPLTPIGEDEDKELGYSPQAVTASPQVKQSPRSPKLQRRSTPEWPLASPLAPPPPITGEQRPMSSDGVARRPRFGKRQSSQFSTATSPVLDAQGRSVSFGRTGKKKKFQGLRRVFGIND